MTELQDCERTIVIERIKKEIADGNIDKAFAGDISNHPQKFSEVIELFQFPPLPGSQRHLDEAERDRIQSFLDAVKQEYCEAQ